jgi:hypothetical protein
MSSHPPSASSSPEPTMKQIPLDSLSISHRARRAHLPEVSPRLLHTTGRLPLSIDPSHRSSRATGDKVPTWLLLPLGAALSSTVRHDRSHPPITISTPTRATHRSVARLSTHSRLLLTHPLPTRASPLSHKKQLDPSLMTTTTVVAMKSQQRKTPGEQSLGRALRDSRTDPGTTRPSEPISPACRKRAGQ